MPVAIKANPDCWRQRNGSEVEKQVCDASHWISSMHLMSQGNAGLSDVNGGGPRRGNGALWLPSSSL